MATISVDSSYAVEGDGSARNYLEWTISLSEPAVDPISIDYRYLSGSALVGTNYYVDGDAYASRTTGSVTFAEGEQIKTLSLRVIPDSESEQDEAVLLELFNPTGEGTFESLGPLLRSINWIRDDDGSGNKLSVYVASPRFVEGDSGKQTAEFEISLSQPAPSGFSFDYSTVDGSAIAGEDYEAKSGTINFAPNQTTAIVSVDILGDTKIESDESFSLSIDVPDGVSEATVEPVVILDDDAAADVNMPSISATGSYSIEGDGSSYNDLVWTLTLSEAPADPVTVSYRFVSGTAIFGNSYYGDPDAYVSRTERTVTFAEGEQSKTVDLRIVADDDVEADEAIVMEVYNPTGGASLAGGVPVMRTVSWIRSDDGSTDHQAMFVSSPVVTEGDNGNREAVFEISLSRPATEAFSVDFKTVNGSGRAGKDYEARSGEISFSEGQTSATVAIAIIGDTDIEPNETFTLVVDAPDTVAEKTVGEATILDDDTAASTSGPSVSVQGTRSIEGDISDSDFLAWTITLSEAASDTVTVDYRYVSGTGDLVYSSNGGGDAYSSSTVSSVTFKPGEQSKTVFLRIDAEQNAEPDESILLEVYNPTGGAVLPDDMPVLRSSAWIQSDDGSADKLALYVASPVVMEGDSGRRTAVFEVSLSRPAPEDFVVEYETVDGSAKAGEDFNEKSGKIKFSEGQSSASVSVTIYGDRHVEADEGFTLAFDTPDIVAETGFGEAIILDDDAGSETNLPVVSVQGSSTMEGDSGNYNYLRWTVTLSEPAIDDVSVEYRFLSGTGTAGLYGSSDADGYPYSNSGTLTFSEGERSKELYFRINAEQDAEPDETIVLELFNTNNGAVFANNAPSLQSASWILSDDGSTDPLALFVSSPTVVENGSDPREVEFEISLSRPAPKNFSVKYETIDISTEAGDDYKPASGKIRFVEGQSTASLVVKIKPDADVEKTESFSLSIDAPDFLTNTSIGVATIHDGSIAGTKGSDVTTGTDFGDVIVVMGGNDRASGKDGDDIILGGSGKDTLKGGDGDDVLKGGKGADRLYGNKHKDTLVAGKGDDKLKGGSGKDKLLGDEGDDTISGGNDSDRIEGGKGKDKISGGNGDDVFIFGKSDGRDTITDFDLGNDVIKINKGANAFRDLDISENRAGAVVSFADTTIVLEDVEVDDLSRDDFLFV